MPKRTALHPRNRVLLDRVYGILKVAKADIEELHVPIDVLDELVALDRDVTNALTQVEFIYSQYPEILE